MPSLLLPATWKLQQINKNEVNLLLTPLGLGAVGIKYFNAMGNGA